MTRQEAIKIAHNLTKAVLDGRLTQMQARNQFKIVAYKYQQVERFKDLQSKDYKLWMRCSDLVGEK